MQGIHASNEPVIIEKEMEGNPSRMLHLQEIYIGAIYADKNHRAHSQP